MFVLAIALSLFALPDEYSSISIYVVQPKRRIDYSSPLNLMSSLQGAQKSTKTTGNRTSYQDVGHTLVELHCENSKNEIVAREFTGVTDLYDYEETQKIYQDGVGFGFVFDGVEGKFLSSEKAYSDFLNISKTETIYALRLSIDLRSCLDLADWVHRVIEKASFTFALNHLPESENQFGCAGFAIRCLEKLGSPIPSSWKREFLVPKSLVGGQLTGDIVKPEKLPEIKESKAWAKDSEAHFKLSFYDPQLIADWIIAKRKSPKFKSNLYTDWMKKHFRVEALDLVLADLQADPIADLKISSDTAP